MKELLVYHVVTDRPMYLGQHIVFDESHHNGVWGRVHGKMDIVNDIYANPDQYDQNVLEHHTSVALRELALEEVRQKKYPSYPSRLGCLYVSETLEEAEKWGELFVEWGRPTYTIVKLRVQGNCFYGDANNCFDGRLNKEENLSLAERYWSNQPNVDRETPIVELLVDGDMEVIEIVKEINANLPNLLKIALLQIAPCGTLDGNLKKGMEYCRKAKEMGADIALFPEMWSNGYQIYHRPVDDWKKEAIPADSDFVNSFKELAKELCMAIGITFLEQCGESPRNTLILFDRFGERKFTYAKVHTCDFDVERNLTPGEDFYVAALDTACGVVNVGAMICYDREFPESARILMLKGAELILVPNACPMEINRLAQLRSRAYENMLAVATCNYPRTVPDCNGNSTVFDGVAYLPQSDGSRDTCILQAGGEEGICIAGLDLAQLRQYRESEVHGNAYRRPKKYGLLIDTKIGMPFVRDNHREQGGGESCHG